MTLPLKPLLSALLHMLGPLERHAICAGSCASPKAKDGGFTDSSSNSGSRESLYSNWAASRTIQDGKGTLLTPGGQRVLSSANISLAIGLSQESLPRIVSLLWRLHPMRTVFMVSLDIFRGVLPACRGYSQALIINEVRVFSGSSQEPFR